VGRGSDRLRVSSVHGYDDCFVSGQTLWLGGRVLRLERVERRGLRYTAVRLLPFVQLGLQVTGVGYQPM
jgi:hypothetical protein